MTQNNFMDEFQYSFTSPASRCTQNLRQGATQTDIVWNYVPSRPQNEKLLLCGVDLYVYRSVSRKWIRQGWASSILFDSSRTQANVWVHFHPIQTEIKQKFFTPVNIKSRSSANGWVLWPPEDLNELQHVSSLRNYMRKLPESSRMIIELT